MKKSFSDYTSIDFINFFKVNCSGKVDTIFVDQFMFWLDKQPPPKAKPKTHGFNLWLTKKAKHFFENNL